jgi:serine/threonine protein kinase
MVHRNLRLESVFVDSDERLRIGTFWFAKCKSDESQSRSAFPAPMIHHSPEVLRGEQFMFDSDVYSYAIFYYLVIECRPPIITRSRSMSGMTAAVLPSL